MNGIRWKDSGSEKFWDELEEEFIILTWMRLMTLD